MADPVQPHVLTPDLSSSSSLTTSKPTVSKAEDVAVAMGAESISNGEPTPARTTEKRRQDAQLGAAPENDFVWPRARRDMQDAFSEFFGVFVMVLFGDGSVAQVTLGMNKFGDYQSISWGWGWVYSAC